MKVRLSFKQTIFTEFHASTEDTEACISAATVYGDAIHLAYNRTVSSSVNHMNACQELVLHLEWKKTSWIGGVIDSEGWQYIWVDMSDGEGDNKLMFE